MLNKIDRTTAQQAAYESLHDAIRDGVYPPGTRLTNRQLAAALGISVTPVREALGRLSSEGALELLDNGSAMVPLLNGSALEQVLWVARVVAARVIEDAVERLTPETLRHLEAMVARIEPLRGPFAGRVAEAFRTFYRELFAISSLGELAAIADRVWVRIGPLHSLLDPDFYQLEGTRHYHEVLEALRRRDGAAASRAFGDLIERLHQFLRTRATGH